MSAAVPGGPARPARAAAETDLVALYGVMRFGLVSGIPVTALLLVIGVVAGSAAITIMMLQAAVDVIVQVFELYAMRQVIVRDPEAFPYGAGKLENFAAFLWAVLSVPAAVYVVATAAPVLVRPDGVSYGLSIVGIAVSAGRLGVLWYLLRRLRRRRATTSPVFAAYCADTTIDLMSNCGVLLSLAVGLLLVRLGLADIGQRVDPGVAIVVGAYQLFVAGGMLLGNFRDLMDLPLPLHVQMDVMRALAARHDAFRGIGVVAARRSGAEHHIDVELQFAADTPLERVRHVAVDLDVALSRRLRDLHLRVSPVTHVVDYEDNEDY